MERFKNITNKYDFKIPSLIKCKIKPLNNLNNTIKTGKDKLKKDEAFKHLQNKHLQNKLS